MTLAVRKSVRPVKAEVRMALLVLDVECVCGRRLSLLLKSRPWTLVCSRCARTVTAELLVVSWEREVLRGG